ncbi:uncharacterized protein LOC127148657 [Cucumis melo]|uniref:Uncharacterized protein LOC127148657 n=1 Tax=Cucumis melo TaxID=3656 RepID=A0ABM3KM09_CUCME|nr:uncharacterized protein LOC127148657 [Cucumis melo]
MGKIEMPILTILENDLICFQFRRPKSVEWILLRGPWHFGGKPMLLRKWTPGIVPESFVFNSVPVWIRLGKIPMELWIEAGLAVVASAVGKPISLDLTTKERRRLSYARVCVELEGGSNMPAGITVSLRGVDFNVSINYEWKPRKCNLCCAFGHSGSKCSRSVESKTIQEEVVHKIIHGKGDGLDSKPCGEVVLESFKQLEEGEIRSSPNRHNSKVEKGVGKSDEFTLVTRKKSELVSVRDCGKSMEVIMPNSFGSLLEDYIRLIILMISWWTWNIRGLNHQMKSKTVFDFLESSFVGYSNSGVGQIWVMWKKNRFSFSTRVVDEQFVTVIERRLLWRRLVEITSAWSSPGVVMGDFNAIRVHSEAFGGSPIQGEMEDFNLAIRDADLVEPSVQGNWFTWTSKVHGSEMLRRLDRVLVNDVWLSAWPTMLVNVLPWGISDHSPILFYPSFQLNSKVVSFRFFNHWVEDPSFIEVVARMWSWHGSVSPLVSLMRNLHHLKPTLRRQLGRHIQSLSKEVRIAKEAMDRTQRDVERNPMSDVLSRQASLATETFWTAVRLEEASLRQKSRIRWLKLGD